MRIKALMLAGACAALALPALARQAAQPAQPAPAPQPAVNTASPVSNQPTGAGALSTGPGESDVITQTLTADQLPAPPPPVEYPAHARRDPWVVGRLDPAAIKLGRVPWGGASGTFLSSLMRRMDTPLAS